MSYKGFYTLKSLCECGYAHAIAQVITASDKQVAHDYVAEIEQMCTSYKIPFFYRGSHFKVRSVYSIAISWRWMLDLPDSKLIILHDSLLPKYRGFSPLVNQLLNQEKEIGATAFFADKNSYDSGPIIDQCNIQIKYPLKIQNAIQMISECYASLIKDIVEKVEREQEILAIPQKIKEASFSVWRNEEDYALDWSASSAEIQIFIYAVGYPYKGAFTLMDGKKIRILDAEIWEDKALEHRHIGKVIFLDQGFPVVICGQGLLKITHAVDDITQTSILPLDRLKIRFR